MITRADVDGRLQRMNAGTADDALPPEGSPEARRLRRWVLHALISEALIATEAAQRGFIDEVDVGALARGGLADTTVARVFEAVTAAARVDETAIRRYYTANLDRYRRPEVRTVRAVDVADERLAAAIVARARSEGELSGAPAGDRGARTSMPQPTTLHLTCGQMTGPVEDAVFAAAPGDVVGPVATELGWHVLRVDRVEPAATLPLDAIRDDILADLEAAERGRRFDEWLGRRRADVVAVSAGHEHPGDPRAPDAIHRH